MKKLAINCLIISSFTFLIGCGSGPTTLIGEEPYITTLIEDNQSIWNAVAIENYMFNYFVEPVDCEAIDIDSLKTIVVVDSKVASVYQPSENHFIDISSGQTIDEIFASMLEESTQNPLTFSANENEIDSLPLFNSVNGIPESYYIDKSENDCDAALIKISNFQVLDDSTVETTIHRNYA